MKARRQRLPKDDRILLDAMLLTEERGSFSTLRAFIDRSGHHLKASTDSELAAEYDRLLVRAEEAFEYERLHGKGSLFNPDHPLNQRFMRIWLKLPPHYVEAIERERARKCQRMPGCGCSTASAKAAAGVS